MISKFIKPNYENTDKWDVTINDIAIEYHQCIDEGLEIEKYKGVFDSVAALPAGELKYKLCNTLYEVADKCEKKEVYKYNEPSTLEEIKALQKKLPVKEYIFDKTKLKSKIQGAWYGRIIGCLLGKPLEGIRSNELVPFLKETDNYPLSRYVLNTDIKEDMHDRYNFHLKNKAYADTVDGMPVDDDTNYLVLYQNIIDKYGRNFTPYNILEAWLKYQCRDSYFTAERVAFTNFSNGFEPPFSAIHKNPYREWIGAQIRGDYFGYINPNEPEIAAEMAFKDACTSHIKNGIYGEMLISAMIARAAVSDDMEDIIVTGLNQIPYSSRLYEGVMSVLEDYKKDTEKEKVFEKIHLLFDEHSSHGWCHTIPNAMIVIASLLYGENDFSKSICLAVGAAFDTDCNGATVGSVLGIKNGIEAIPEEWISPLNDTLYTSIFGYEKLKISNLTEKTFKHII